MYHNTDLQGKRTFLIQSYDYYPPLGFRGQKNPTIVRIREMLQIRNLPKFNNIPGKYDQRRYDKVGHLIRRPQDLTLCKDIAMMEYKI